MDNSLWVWLDLEMTGLNVTTDTILEASCIITSPDLSVITHEPFSMVVHHDNQILENMSDWCIEHHQKSGLTQAVKEAKLNLEEVEKSLIQFVQSNSLDTDTLYLVGNSIHMDRLFIQTYMKGLDSLLHYRMIDITAIRLFLETIGVTPYKKASSHRACDDIVESIEELKYYKNQLTLNGTNFFF